MSLYGSFISQIRDFDENTESDRRCVIHHLSFLHDFYQVCIGLRSLNQRDLN